MSESVLMEVSRKLDADVVTVHELGGPWRE